MSAFEYRPLRREDLDLLHAWLNRPHVAEWWDDRLTREHVEEDFGAEIGSPVIRHYLAYLDGEPVGFIQDYNVMGADPEWWPDAKDPGARGIDQFLANEHQLGKGLGSRMVRELVARLFADPAVTTVQTDPRPDNARAIRAYEKAGFRRLHVVDTPDGPALLMLAERERR